MNAKSIGKILNEIIKWGPPIAATGKEIYDNIQGMFDNRTSSNTKPEGITLQGLDKKINQLEQNDLDQAKLLSEITQQTSNLSELSRALITRITFAIIIASISFIISLYLLIRSF